MQNWNRFRGGFIIFFLLLTLGCGNKWEKGNPKVEAGEGKITLAWDSNLEKDLKGYKIYYGVKSKEYKNSIDIGLGNQQDNATTFTLTGLAKDQRYFIAITSYNKSGVESGSSNEVTGIAK